MKVTLQVDGREMTFSEQELIAIVKEHYATKEATKQSTKAKQEPEGPKEGVPFEVNPLAIDQTLFQPNRDDKEQERTRQLILEAFTEVKANPERYGKPFYTLMPKKTWDAKTFKELKEFACKAGDHEADWVEQALEWAQRIDNGETWYAVCNRPDTALLYRAIIWKNGHTVLIGGARDYNNDSPASDVGTYNYNPRFIISDTVPLVVLYK